MDTKWLLEIIEPSFDKQILDHVCDRHKYSGGRGFLGINGDSKFRKGLEFDIIRGLIVETILHPTRKPARVTDYKGRFCDDIGWWIFRR